MASNDNDRHDHAWTEVERFELPSYVRTWEVCWCGAARYGLLPKLAWWGTVGVWDYTRGAW